MCAQISMNAAECCTLATSGVLDVGIAPVAPHLLWNAAVFVGLPEYTLF